MRAGIFIDGGYILTQLKLQNIVPDYERLADYFLAPLRRAATLDLMRCYFYYCPPWTSENPTEDEGRRLEKYESFVEQLQGLDRWAIRQGKLERRFDGKKEYFEQKRVDVLLSCDLVRHAAAGHIQHAVLVAGDSDFIPAVEAAKESGVTITLYAGESNTVHNDLIILSDEVHHFDWKLFPKEKATQAKSNNTRARAVSQRKKARNDRKPERRDSFDPDIVAEIKAELGLSSKNSE